MEKIKKTSKIIDRVLSVLFWIVAVCAAVSVAAFAVILFRGDGIPAAMSTKITLGNYKITLAGPFEASVRPIALITIIHAALAAGFSCYAIRVLKQIFSPMSQGLPFNRSVSASIRKIAWVQFLYGVLGVVLQAITHSVFYQTLEIASLFDPEKVTGCTLSVVSDGSFLVWFVLLLLLSRVFQYGEQLQQLSDETL